MLIILCTLILFCVLAYFSKRNYYKKTVEKFQNKECPSLIDKFGKKTWYQTDIIPVPKTSPASLQHSNTCCIEHYANTTKIWIYLETHYNSRDWNSFYGRSSSDMPPYIYTCIRTILQWCKKKKYNQHLQVEVLTPYNLVKFLPQLDLNIALDKKIPLYLRKHLIATGLLYHYGGIWMDPSTILLCDLRDILKKLEFNDVIAFGCASEEYRCQNSYLLPNLQVYASKAGNHLMKQCFIDIHNHFQKNNSNFEFNNPCVEIIRNNLKYFVEEGKIKYFQYSSKYNGSRDHLGKLITLDNLLSIHETRLMCDDCAFFIVIDYQRLMLNKNLEWFRRMSESQILNSNLWISELFRTALRR